MSCAQSEQLLYQSDKYSFNQSPKVSSSQREQLSKRQICGGNACWCSDTKPIVRVRTLLHDAYVRTVYDNNISYSYVLQVRIL